MNKIYIFGIALVLIGCSAQETLPTGTIKLKPVICSIAAESPSLGIVSISYQNPNNKVRLPGVGKGLVVVKLVENSPAHLDDFPIGSVIKTVNGIEVSSPEQLSSIFKEKKTGIIEIEYATDSGIKHKKLKLKNFGEFTDNCTFRYITENT
jgi:S1-C subfamily serine protease